MLRALFLTAVFLGCTGCQPQPESAPTDAAEVAVPAEDHLLGELSGVWRGASSGSLLYLARERERLRIFIPEGEIPVGMGSLDPRQGTVNLTLDGGERELVWTLSKVTDKDTGDFHLRVTVDDGQQQDFSFVRAVAQEDLRRLHQLARADLATGVLAALVTGGEVVGISVDDETAGQETSVSLDSEAEDAEGDESVRIMEGDVAPSFDCDRQLNAAEAMVCGDEEVAELDRRLSKAYRLVLSRSDQPEAERSTQMRWLADKRNACDTVSCLRKAYRQRLKYFEGPPHYAYSEFVEGG